MNKLDFLQEKSGFKLPLFILEQLQKFETNKQKEIQPDTWVTLKELPNPYSHDEALILCQASLDYWCVWIPEHGEAVLHRSKLVMSADGRG